MKDQDKLENTYERFCSKISQNMKNKYVSKILGETPVYTALEMLENSLYTILLTSHEVPYENKIELFRMITDITFTADEYQKKIVKPLSDESKKTVEGNGIKESAERQDRQNIGQLADSLSFLRKCFDKDPGLANIFKREIEMLSIEDGKQEYLDFLKNASMDIMNHVIENHKSLKKSLNKNDITR